MTYPQIIAAILLSFGLGLSLATPARPDTASERAAAALHTRNYNTVHFDFDRDALDAVAVTRIRKQAQFIRRRPDVMFAVTGHTDRVGNLAYNKSLGMRRARRVVSALVQLGVNPRQLMAMVSYGELHPVVDTQSRERLNRRVVTTVMMPDDLARVGVSSVRTKTSSSSVPPAAPPASASTPPRSPAPAPSSPTPSNPAPSPSPSPSPSPAPAPAPSPAPAPAPAPSPSPSPSPAPSPSPSPSPEPTPEPEPAPEPTGKPRPGNSAYGTGKPDAGAGNGDEASGDPEGSVGHNNGKDETP